MSSESELHSIALSLEPLDLLFFRDGRPFNASALAQSGLPTPQTLAGALRTAMLRGAGFNRFQDLHAALRNASFRQAISQVDASISWLGRTSFSGPWLCEVDRKSGSIRDVFVPTPPTLQFDKGSKSSGCEVVRMDPLDPGKTLPGWRAPIGAMRPLWPRRKAILEPVGGFLTSRGLKKFLDGESPTLPDEKVDESSKRDFRSAEELYGFDRRTGISIDVERQTAAEGMIYGASFLALKPQVGFYAEIHLPNDAPHELLDSLREIAFGGEGRRVAARRVEPWKWPSPTATKCDRTAIYLTSPAFFDQGSGNAAIPDSIRESSNLAGAAVGGYVAVSGWDLAAGGPKPNRFGVPAGSVYFLDGPTDSLPARSLAEGSDRELGWGTYLKGVWNYV